MLAERRWVLLINPGFPVDTRWAYQQLAASREGTAPVRQSALGDSSVLNWHDIIRDAANDFEPPVFQAHPLLRDVKSRLAAGGSDMALLSGSGATLFGVFSDKTSAARAYELFRGEPQYRVFLVETCTE